MYKLALKTEIEAKQIALSIANSPLVKTAIAGEDPNWGRIIMAIGKAGPKINLNKISIKFGNLKIVQDGKLHQSYDEKKTAGYMKNDFQLDKYENVKKTIKSYQKFIKDNFKFVGENFAYEARSIHYNPKKKSKGIYGNASKKDLMELKEEGIDAQMIPWVEDKDN